jgi:hypothetical protein
MTAIRRAQILAKRKTLFNLIEHFSPPADPRAESAFPAARPRRRTREGHALSVADGCVRAEEGDVNSL